MDKQQAWSRARQILVRERLEVMEICRRLESVVRKPGWLCWPLLPIAWLLLNWFSKKDRDLRFAIAELDRGDPTHARNCLSGYVAGKEQLSVISIQSEDNMAQPRLVMTRSAQEMVDLACLL